MNLSDSDIFKAQLYKVAQKNNSEKDFIQHWDDLTQSAESAKANLDDIFRIYSRIIRDKNGVKDKEFSLRKFFTDSSIKSQVNFNLSQQDDWKNILYELERICKCVKYLSNDAPPEVAKWITILKLGNKVNSLIESPLYACLFEYLIDSDNQRPHLSKEKEKEFEN